jgi:hypothetical protein
MTTNQTILSTSMADMLSSRFLKVTLVTKFPGNSLRLPEVAAQVEASHGAEIGKAVKAQKTLYSADFLKAASTARSAMRTKHNSLTSAWDGMAWRILPNNRWTDYANELNPLISAFDKAADEAARKFDYELMNSRQRLGSLFVREDYPADAAEFRQKFQAETPQEPLPVMEDAKRLLLPATEIERIQKSMQSALQDNVNRVMAEGFDRVFTVAKNLRDSLQKFARGDQRTVHSTLIEQVLLACDYCAQFNLAGDSHMSALIEDMRNSLTKYEMQVIRDDPAKQAEVIEAATTIVDKAAARRARMNDLGGAYGTTLQ